MYWPIVREEYRRNVMLTTIEEFTRRSGQQPTFSDLACPANGLGTIQPIWVPQPFLAKRIGIFNGTVVSGNVAVALSVSLGFSIAMTFAAQSGTSQIQWFNIPDTYLPAGWAWLEMAIDNTTGRFQSMISAASKESNYAGSAWWTTYPPGSSFAASVSGILPVGVIAGVA